MSNLAIKVEGLGKEYRIGAAPERYKTFRDAIIRTATGPFRRARELLRGGAYGASGLDQTIWALKDVSFEVNHGDVVGIIGRNGAGKSTLLKILSRITEPTTGRIDLYGRVGALLEVGTGFHPELTGRENVYLNAAILGMHRVEIDRKFDEIVAFAEVEKFIDTPVKHYSSGMGLRLGFAVAAHLEPEILIVDEVLAVGDAEFQRKCLNKMQAVSQDGRTILFVSHNMAAIRNICETAVILEKGFITAYGETNTIVDHYLSRTSVTGGWHTIETEHFIVDDLAITSHEHPVVQTFDQISIKAVFKPKIDVNDPGIYIGISTNDNHRLTGVDFKDFYTAPQIKAGQTVEMGFLIDSLPLLPGSYQIELHLKDMATHTIDIVPQSLYFDIPETPVYGGRQMNRWFGHVALNVQSVICSMDGVAEDEMVEK